MIIEISTHGSSIRRRRERFVICIPNTKDQEFPAEKIDAILINANALVSTSAMKLCIERQIQLVLMSYNRPIGRIWSSSFGRQTQIRRQQYLNTQSSLAYDITKKLLVEKITKQRAFLSDLRHNKKSVNLKLKLFHAISFMNSTISKIKDSLFEKDYEKRFLGFEGSCASVYFEMLSQCLPTKWQFQKRTQNPGLDGFNISLNYLYGMAYYTIEKVVILSGLDPNAGFYHKDHYGKPTLVFDLIEPCRPLIDKALVSIFNKKIARDDWFLRSDAISNLELTKEAKSNLITCFRENCQDNIEKTTWITCKQLTLKLLELDKYNVK